MRILHFDPECLIWTHLGLIGGFINLGHDVKSININGLNKEETVEKVGTVIKDFKPEMIITTGGQFQNFEAEELWKVIKKYKIPHIYWATEDPTFLDWSSTVHLQAYDFVFTVSEICVPIYTNLGTPAAYLSYGCNPEIHKPVKADKKYENDIVVLSNKYKEYDPKRCAFRHKCFHNLIEPVIKAGYDLKIYGNRWGDGTFDIPDKYLAETVPLRLVPTIYSSAKIVLIIQWDYTGHICSKTYEAFGCKCLQIAPYTPLQARYFKDGEQIIYSHSPQETLKYIDYYLSHDEEREEIAANGQQEAYQNHSITVRARTALQTLKEHGFAIDFIEK